jgi:hypothetical protein
MNLFIRMAKFTETLEKKARQLKIGLKHDDSWDLSLPSMIKREIALTVDQIDQVRKLHDDQLDSLQKNECDINTELMQMEDRTPRYSPYKYPEREKFMRSLLGIETEQRRIKVRTEERLRSLEKQLLLLMNKHEQIQTLDYEHRKAGTKTRTPNATRNISLAPGKRYGRYRAKGIN